MKDFCFCGPGVRGFCRTTLAIIALALAGRAIPSSVADAAVRQPEIRQTTFGQISGNVAMRCNQNLPTGWTEFLSRGSGVFSLPEELTIPGVGSVRNFLAQAGNFDGLMQLRFVNSAWNGLRYISDSRNYGTKDHWATPAELISHGGGDCEDYALAKYATLR